MRSVLSWLFCSLCLIYYCISKYMPIYEIIFGFVMDAFDGNYENDGIAVGFVLPLS